MGGGALSSSYKENMPFIPSHMVQSSKSKGRPQPHNLLKSVSDPNMTFLPPPHPLITETTGPKLNSLRPPVSPSPSELSSDSLTQLTLVSCFDYDIMTLFGPEHSHHASHIKLPVLF